MRNEILAIADDGSNDRMARAGKDVEGTGYDLNGEHEQRSRLRVDISARPGDLPDRVKPTGKTS